MEWLKRKPDSKNDNLSFLAHRRLLLKYCLIDTTTLPRKKHDEILNKRKYHALMCDEIVSTNKKVTPKRKKEIYNSVFKK